MENQRRRSELIQRLSAAASAHGDYEANVLHGVYDEQWAEWYATHLLGEGWNDLFKQEWSSAELTEALRQAHLAHQSAGSGRSWQEFYADRFLETA